MAYPRTLYPHRHAAAAADPTSTAHKRTQDHAPRRDRPEVPSADASVRRFATPPEPLSTGAPKTTTSTSEEGSSSLVRALPKTFASQCGQQRLGRPLQRAKGVLARRPLR